MSNVDRKAWGIPRYSLTYRLKVFGFERLGLELCMYRRCLRRHVEAWRCHRHEGLL